MSHIQDDLSQRIRSLERELQAALEDKEHAFRYHWVNGKARFEKEVLSHHSELKSGIKHARRLRSPHSRYTHFFDYGDADDYHRDIERVRSDFVDLRTLTSRAPNQGR